jgi:hypothetical protein
MTPKASKRKHSDELIAVKVMREQDWAYERWLEYVSYQAMRVQAAHPPAEGGLGYDLSLAALEGLVKGYREREGLSELTRDEARERRAHDLALVMRSARASMRNAAKVGALDVHATKLMLEAGRDLAKHYGTDQPITVEANVTHRDAVTEELNAMLVRLGEAPIEVDS